MSTCMASPAKALLPLLRGVTESDPRRQDPTRHYEKGVKSIHWEDGSGWGGVGMTPRWR